MQGDIRLKVTVVTDSRADYAAYYPLLKAMEDDNRFQLQLFVTGMHLLEEYGHTIGEMAFPFYTTMPASTDFVLVLGDRRPMLDATIEAAYKGIPIAHIQGGDRSGTIDDPARHAITRFANLHFPCTDESADRLIRMGEEPWRIKVVGPLGIYAMPETEFIPKDKLCETLGLDYNKNIILVIQHPVNKDTAWEEMITTLEAVKGYQTVVIYPNSDPGSDKMIKAIKSCSWVKSFPYLPYLIFLSLLKSSDVIVGNSSAGLYDAPLFAIPCVNIGTRQQDRQRGNNVVNMIPNAFFIKQAISQALGEGKRIGNNPFKVDVDGVSIILNALAVTPINERLLQKRIIY